MSRLDEYNARRRLDRARSRSGPIGIPRERGAAVRSQPCRACSAHHEIEVHHIVPRSQFGKRDETVHAPENLMPLCHRCHQNHHTTTQRIPRALLSCEEFAFGIGKMGYGWMDQWYPEVRR